ncbi:response regulator [Novosphingobium sp. MW5]|nr:response regulator [Novosphingobium sp. MW5]
MEIYDIWCHFDCKMNCYASRLRYRVAYPHAASAAHEVKQWRLTRHSILRTGALPVMGLCWLLTMIMPASMNIMRQSLRSVMTALATADPLSALREIANNPRIVVVISDVQMPDMDGISLLEEMAARFIQSRPMAAIAITGHPSLEVAVSAMRSSAMDFLSKPVCKKDLAAALRRAMARVSIQADRLRLDELTKTSTLTNSEARELMGSLAEPTGKSQPTPSDLIVLARSMIKARQLRFDFLDAELFSDPSWDILLELTCATLEAKPIPSASACAASNAPMTTALRHISRLVETGMVIRENDPGHGRRIFLSLSDGALLSMTSYLTSTWHRQFAGGR